MYLQPIPPPLKFSKLEAKARRSLFTQMWQKRRTSFGFELCVELLEISLQVGQDVSCYVAY